MRIVIVGGGITGLACALRLQELQRAAAEATPRVTAPQPRVGVTLIEASPRLGGKLVSDRVQGFVVDAGADIFLASKPGAVELCTTLGIAHRVIGTDDGRRRTFVRAGTTLVPASHYGAERLATLEGGMQELVDAAARALRATEVLAGAAAGPVVDIAGRARHRDATSRYRLRVSGRDVGADAVVVAVPARAAATLLRQLAPRAAALLEAVRYRSSFTVSAGYHALDVPHALDGYGYLVPGAGAGEVSACTWTSSKIPSRAPAGHVLLRGYVHGAPGLSTYDARRLVLDEFRRVLGVTTPPLFTHEADWRDALPVAHADAAAAGAAVRSVLASHPGIAIAGGAVDGVGIPDSIRSGQAAAERIWQQLTTARAEEASTR